MGNVSPRYKQPQNRAYVILLLLMDLPCLRWQDYVAKKWIGLETEQKEQFVSFEEIDDVFNYVRPLIRRVDSWRVDKFMLTQVYFNVLLCVL